MITQFVIMENKRSLTNQEIKNILSFIKPLRGIPEEIGDNIALNHFENHAKQLRAIQIYPSKITALKERIEHLFFKSQIEPGKSVGALASSSIGEKNTQSSLSSFHQSGQSKVELLVGIPRLEEILNVTRNLKTPCMEVYLDLPEDQLKDLEVVKKVAQEVLEYKEMVDFIVDYDMIKNRELTTEENIWYSYHNTFIGTEYQKCKWSVRLMFNVNTLYSYSKMISSIANIIHTNYTDAYCVASPDIDGIIDIYIKTSSLGNVEEIIQSIKTSRRKTKKEEDDSNIDILINEDNKEYYFIRDMIIPAILNIQIGGIDRIKHCYYQEKADGTWFVTTKGSNLKAVISHPKINPLETCSNNLWDNFETLGIEATRKHIKIELEKLISISSRHLDLLINCMTQSGRPQAVSRYGIDRKQVGVLAKVAFEQPFDNFFHSATLAEKEDMLGVSSAITVGNVPALGSGYMGMIDKLSGKLIDDEQEMHKYNQYYIDMLKTEQENNPKPINRPKKLQSSHISPMASSFPSGNRPLKKAVIVSKKALPFVPNIYHEQKLEEAKQQEENNKCTVTRIIMSSLSNQTEVEQLGDQPQIAFHTTRGQVVERLNIPETSFKPPRGYDQSISLSNLKDDDSDDDLVEF
jgi:hypothetical protein